MMKQVYFDNAASTPLDPAVLEAMLPYLNTHFGNPSSTHGHGRALRAAIEKSRKTVAQLLNVSTSEIFFTSGGTESDNIAIRSAVCGYNLKHAITAETEHKAVLYTLKELEEKGTIKLSFARLNDKGEVDLEHLEELLKTNSRSLVSIMHGNNEIATLQDIETIGELCETYNALFHSDTVQTMAHFPHDMQKLKAHFITGSAHKFHGAKGIGFLFVRKGVQIPAYMTGGAQERNMRGGTENVMGIVGLAKAMDIAYAEMDAHTVHIKKVKAYMVERLRQILPDVHFNGTSAEIDNSLYTVLSVCFPAHPMSSMLLFNLDIKGISASGGSACSSGSNIGSHVLNALGSPIERPTVRFSFSKYSTIEEVDFVMEQIEAIYKTEAVVKS